MQVVLPRALWNAHFFSCSNAVAFSIVLGAPVVLFAKTLGASETVVGVMAALTPLLNILQVPGARLIPRLGYRRLMLAGWGIRTLFVFAIAAIPPMAFLSPAARIWLLLAFLVLFNGIRGWAAGVWMPWLAVLVHPEHRGRFLARDMGALHIGCFLAVVVSGLVLGSHPSPIRFSVVFLLSGVAGLVSVAAIRRVPDVDAPGQLRKSGHPVPWREIFRYPPFIAFVVFHLLLALVLGGFQSFVVAFLHGTAGISADRILWASSLTSVGALVTLPLCGRVLDISGSKPLLRATLLVVTFVTAGWWCVVEGWLAPTGVVTFLLFIVFGSATANMGIASSRLLLDTMPEMGRNHFFALFSTVTSIGQAVTPVLWGLFLDGIGSRAWVVGGVTWNRFGIYFAVIALLTLATLASVNRLTEQPGRKLTEAFRLALLGG